MIFLRRQLLLSAFGLLAPFPLLAASASARDILAAADNIRNPDKPFRVVVTLLEYRKGKQTDQTTLSVLSRKNPRTGQFRSLIGYLAPARDRGKLILSNGADLWYFDPSSKASIRISPQQRLLGQAANGDVMTVSLANDYRATLAASEEIKDGDMQAVSCHKLNLTAAATYVTYHRIELWVSQSNNRPVRARYYSESGQLLKTAYFRRFENHLGKERPTETVIIDGLDPAWVTVMRVNGHAWRDVPETWFQRDYLPRYREQ